MSGSSLLGSVLCRESSRSIYGFLALDCRFSPKWHKIRRLQWLLLFRISQESIVFLQNLKTPTSEKTHQQTMGTKIYLFENICFFLIQLSTFVLVNLSLYRKNHKQSRYIQDLLLCSGVLLHNSLYK